MMSKRMFRKWNTRLIYLYFYVFLLYLFISNWYFPYLTKDEEESEDSDWHNDDTAVTTVLVYKQQTSIMYKDGGWSSKDVFGVDKEEASLVIKITDGILLDEANAVLKDFRKLDIEWEKEIEDVKTKEVDIFDNLMPLNPGKLYLKLQEKTWTTKHTVWFH